MTASSPGPGAGHAPPAREIAGIPDDADGDEDVNVLTLAGQIPSQDGEWLLVTSLDDQPAAGFLEAALAAEADERNEATCTVNVESLLPV